MRGFLGRGGNTLAMDLAMMDDNRTQAPTREARNDARKLFGQPPEPVCDCGTCDACDLAEFRRKFKI